MMEYHRMNKADLTIAVLEVSAEEAQRFGVLCVDEDLRVTSFEEKPHRPVTVPGRATCFASMGNYIFSGKKLIDLLKKGKRKYEDLDFGKHVIPMMLEQGGQGLCLQLLTTTTSRAWSRTSGATGRTWAPSTPTTRRTWT